MRWLLALLIVLNAVVFAAVQGAFGPLPFAGPHEFRYVIEQVNADSLQVRPETAQEAADQAVVGTPSDPAPVKVKPLSPNNGATNSGSRP
jgi:hypothetical protein